MPPPRPLFDHKIPLKDQTVPINIRPYRYSLAQKDIIEQLTQELLDQGVIRDSNSPFVAPIVLVKKKDGGHRMCVGFRALNKSTVKDKLPIPIIELLDELSGFNYSPKLISNLVIIILECTQLTFIKKPLRHIVAILSSWLCLLG